MYRRCNCQNMFPCKEKSICENVQNNVDEVDICECGFEDEDEFFPKNPSLGQSYVPWQTMGKTFIPKAALKNGTIFPELVSPYVPCQSMEEIAYIEANNKIGMGCNKCQMN